jgi:hypothetical protein
MAPRPPAPRAHERRWEKHGLFATELAGDPPVERGEAELLDSRDTVPCDHVRETADDAREESRPGGIVGSQVILYAEGLHVVESGLLEDRPEAGADRRRCTGSAECPHDPVAHVVDQADTRFSARSAHVEIDGDEQAARAKILHVMANGHDRVREMKEHEPADNSVEWFAGTPAADVALDERHVTLSRRLDALAGDSKRLDGPIESDDRPFAADQFSCKPRNVAESRPEIEHAQAGDDAGCLEKQAGRRPEPGRLAIQPAELVMVAAEHVCVVEFVGWRSPS